MLVRVARRGHSDPPAQPAGGPECLFDRGLLPQWFIRYRLAEEVNEAGRYSYPLSIVVLSPMVVAGEPLAERRVKAGALAAKAAARTTDLVGWLDGDDILFVLPHTDLQGARSAVERWQQEMELQPSGVGGLRWLASVTEHGQQFDNGAQLLEAALRQFRGLA